MGRLSARQDLVINDKNPHTRGQVMDTIDVLRFRHYTYWAQTELPRIEDLPLESA